MVLATNGREAFQDGIRRSRVRALLKESFSEYRPMFAVLASYSVFGTAVLAFLGRSGAAHLPRRLQVCAALSVIYLGGLYLVRISQQFARFLARMIEQRTGVVRVTQSALGPYPSPPQLAGLVVICAAVTLFLSMFSNLKQAMPLINPFAWDEFLTKVDYYLHGREHPWILLHGVLGTPAITKAIDSIYVSWFGILYLFLVGFTLSPQRSLRTKFYVSFMLTWGVAGTVLAMFFSSAGPCYYGRINTGADPYLPLMEYLRSVHDVRFLDAIQFQEGLWLAHAASDNLIFGGISAMPSIHVATAVLFAMASWEIHRALGTIFIVYALVIQVGSVHLGWHYAIDGYLGAVLAVAIWRFSDRVLKM